MLGRPGGWCDLVDDLGGVSSDAGVEVADKRIIDLSLDPTVTSAAATLDAGVYAVTVATTATTDSWSVVMH